MSQHQKETLVSFIANIIVTIPYLLFILNKFQNETFTHEGELKFWATAILLIIPIRIIVHIIIFILLSIARGIFFGESKNQELNDERDKLIELKGDRISHYTFAIVVIASMLAILFGGTLSAMFIVMIIGGFISELIGIFARVYYYRAGV
jgi:hypothetical protein